MDSFSSPTDFQDLEIDGFVATGHFQDLGSINFSATAHFQELKFRDFFPPTNFQVLETTGLSEITHFQDSFCDQFRLADRFSGPEKNIKRGKLQRVHWSIMCTVANLDQ